MSNRMILYLTGLVLFGMLVIFGLNMANTFGITGGRYISGNDVRGMALDAKGKLWTLNFDQQRDILEILNKAKPMQSSSGDKQIEFVNNAGFDRLVIYRFGDQTDLIITPIGYLTSQTTGEANLQFTAPAWNPNGTLRENSNGKLKQILDSAYDKNR